MNLPDKTKEEIIREIESGKYRDYYLIYNRKSTDEPENQKNSIKYQNAENMRYAFRHTLELAPITIEGFCRNGVVSEKHSAFAEDDNLEFGENNSVKYRIERPKFYRVAVWLHKGYFRGAIFLCFDRASRNKGDTKIVNNLMRRVDIHFSLTKYDKSSSGELHQDIDGMFAEHHSRVTKEKVSLTIKNSRERGFWTNKAPVGYLNPKSMESKPKDPERADKILEFAKLADKDWSLADIARWAIDGGFSMPPVRRRRTEEEMLADEESDEPKVIEKTVHLPTANTIHKILTNRFYTGKIPTKNGEWIPSKCHEAIIPEPLFNRVQEKLKKRNKSVHYKKVLEHALRGVFSCAFSGRVFTPYEQKGILYFGARCPKDCPNTNHHFNVSDITQKVGDLINLLPFTKDELELFDARTSTEIAVYDVRRQEELEKGERKKKEIREKLNYLAVHRLDLLKAGAYSPEALVSEENKLRSELSLLQEKEVLSDEEMRKTLKDLEKLSELVNNLDVIYKNATPREKETIIKEIFSELKVNGETLEYQCTRGFQPLAHHFIALGDLTGNRTPV